MYEFASLFCWLFDWRCKIKRIRYRCYDFPHFLTTILNLSCDYRLRVMQMPSMSCSDAMNNLFRCLAYLYGDAFHDSWKAFEQLMEGIRTKLYAQKFPWLMLPPQLMPPIIRGLSIEGTEQLVRPQSDGSPSYCSPPIRGDKYGGGRADQSGPPIQSWR